jgi:hypothetical protein
LCKARSADEGGILCDIFNKTADGLVAAGSGYSMGSAVSSNYPREAVLPQPILGMASPANFGMKRPWEVEAGPLTRIPERD